MQADERPRVGPSGPANVRVRPALDTPLGIEQGAGFEDLMPGEPQVFGKDAQVCIRPRQIRQSLRRFAILTKRSVQLPRGAELRDRVHLTLELLVFVIGGGSFYDAIGAAFEAGLFQCITKCVPT